MNKDNENKKITEVLGTYRAEYLGESIFKLFAEPSYFTDLEQLRPCVLQGGRGSGKTTVLRGLSYQGQFAFHKSDFKKFAIKTKYIGIYHRVDTNHVRAFEGDEIDYKKWRKIFSHYFNLVMCRELALFLDWLSLHTDKKININSDLIFRALQLEFDKTKSLLENTNNAFYDFQFKINNISNDTQINCSVLGDPIKIFIEEIKKTALLKNKSFFIILDEYENYSDYQQEQINTLIKHFNNDIVFKIGVRELGWRKKSTANEKEFLSRPADYSIIEIEQCFSDNDFKLFKDFASKVCSQRINEIYGTDSNQAKFDIETALLKYTKEEEAIVLGVEKTIEFKKITTLKEEYLLKIKNIPSLYKYLISSWAIHIANKSLLEMIDDFVENKSKWDDRYNNYGYSLLFKIRKGRGSAGISKYYAGWSTYVKLSAGNIRYLMELIFNAYRIHIKDGKHSLSTSISQKTQTEAAIFIAEKNIIQLESLFSGGEKLTKVLLGLGEVFRTLAEGYGAPEVNQFSIKNESPAEDANEYKKLFDFGIMNLALIKETGNKLSKYETKDFIYYIHPIFAPFFKYSYRKKRKTQISSKDILDLIKKDPTKAIKSILEAEQTKQLELNF